VWNVSEAQQASDERARGERAMPRERHGRGGGPPPPAISEGMGGGGGLRSERDPHPNGPRGWTDSELLGHMLIRSEAAWKEFLRRYHGLIYRCIHKVTARFTGLLTNEDAQDIYALYLVNLVSDDMRRLRCFCPQGGH